MKSNWQQRLRERATL